MDEKIIINCHYGRDNKMYLTLNEEFYKISLLSILKTIHPLASAYQLIHDRLNPRVFCFFVGGQI